MKLELKETNHRYYCSDTNYYVGGANGQNYGLVEFPTWDDFKYEWLDNNLSIDHDYNHCFRFDIKKKYDRETDTESDTEFSLHLYFMMQRKGNFVPVYIESVTEGDMEDVNAYLDQCWTYIKNQWIEFQ